MIKLFYFLIISANFLFSESSPSLLNNQSASHLLNSSEVSVNPSDSSDTNNTAKPDVEDLSYKFSDESKYLELSNRLKESETSYFETFLSSGLKQFGYDFFYKSPSSFVPDQKISVTPDYMVGPGDELIINIWGRMNARWVVSVERDGSIYLPKIGMINVTGVEFQNLNDFLRREISRYYSDFNINVSLGNIRSIRVYVVGNVKHPGAYTLPGISTMISALFGAGGPAKTGTMRNIELKRSGKTISVMDLYNFLINGDKSSDLKLVNDDVIYVPPIGRVAAIGEGVKNPGIYELKENERLIDLIKMAGGFLNTAYNKKVSIKRIFDNRYRDYLELDISDIEKDFSKNIELADGDLIMLKSIVDFDTSVNIYGAVVYPGKIGIKQGETRISDVIKFAGGLLINASGIAEITRFNKTDKGVETERLEVNVKNAIAGNEKDNLILKDYDSIVIKSIPDWYYPKLVYLSGEINSPGAYPIEKGERLYSVLKRAQGFTKNAYPRGIIFTRQSVKADQQKVINETADRLEKELLSGSAAAASSSLSIEEVQSQQYVYEQKKRFLAQIRNAKATGRIYIKFENLDNLKDSTYDIELQEGDEIIIPQKSDVVNVSGSVMASGSYVYKSKSYKSYIDMAGGYSYYADKGRTFILRYDGSAAKAKSGLFSSTKVEPGDTIVVPEKFETIAWLREIRDITQIITNLAISAGVVIKVF
jgi:polysaccharide export outer membrane protein